MTNVIISTSRGIPVRLPLPDWSELTVDRRRSPRLAGGFRGLRGSVGRDPRLRRVLGRLPHGLPLGRARRSASRFRCIPTVSAAGRAGLGPDRGKLLVLRPEAECEEVGIDARTAESGHERSSDPRKQINWLPALETVWKSDGAIPPS